MASAPKTSEISAYEGAGQAKGNEDRTAGQPRMRYSESESTGADPFDLPNISLGAAGIAGAKAAGRLNASSISRDEHEAYLVERSRLLDKFFSGTITRKEELRLEYVRWTLDRIEDATHGTALDMLESHVEIYESFAAELQYFHSQVAHLTGKRR